MKLLFAFVFFLTLETRAAWDLNDVSYLMPLPSSLTQDGLLKVDSADKRGALLAKDILGGIPILAPGMDREQSEAALRVVGVRIDPCFPLPTPQACQRQLRLVWQPLELAAGNRVTSVDAALHSFYVLSDSEFESLAQDLQSWKGRYPAQTDQLSLQVHPAWQKDLDSSASLAAFNRIVLKYAGRDNLSRLTVMVLRGMNNMWVFAALEVQSDKMNFLPVPRLGGKQSQAFVNVAVPADFFSGGGMTPRPNGDDTLNNLVAESSKLETKSEDLIRHEVKAAYRVENPKNFTPENMDCVSCHVAMPAIQWVLNKRPDLKVAQHWEQEIYKNNKYNLSNVSPEMWNTQAIRAMGYFGSNIALSQRVINESAEVADLLNQMFPQKPNP